MIRTAVSDFLKSPSAEKAGNAPAKGSHFQLASPTKRPLAVYEEDHNSDEENVNPVGLQSAKRTKFDEQKTDFEKPSFRLAVDKAFTPSPSLTAPTKRKYGSDTIPTPIKAPSSAPVPREIKPLKHKRVNLLGNKRPTLSPYKRIDPPVLGTRKSTGGLPFSIDAAISGTVGSSPTPTKTPRLHKAMPKGWFFDIHEDTPDEEASIVMQHTCGQLDLSSDDEEGPALKKVKIGKENIAPADYVAAHVNANVFPRSRARKTDVNAMTDDGDRSPLSDLAPEDYFANGLTQDSVAVVDVDENEENQEQAEAEVQQAEQEQQAPQQEDFTFAAYPMPAQGEKDEAGSDDVGFTIAEDPVESQP